SAMISGSEAAYFSLKTTDVNEIKANPTRVANIILALLAKPRMLLATILISNTLVNIALIILAALIFEQIRILWTPENTIPIFLIEIVTVTFLLIIIGEVIPKVYATHYNKRFAGIMAFPLYILSK